MKQRTLQHIIGWLLFLGYDYYQNLKDDDEIIFDSVAIITADNIIFIFTFYFTYLILAPRLFPRFNYVKAFLAVLIGIFFFIVCRYLIEEVIFDLVFGFTNYYGPSQELPFYILDNLWRGFMPVISGIIIFLLEKKIQNDKDQLVLKEEKKSAELAYLRSQMNPHFLFNTLSFLHTEAYLVDPKLADTVLSLSDILRYSVESTKGEKVMVEEEINLFKNYISIFKKRFEKKCFINLNLKGGDYNQKIEPLLMIPFLENAIKHGVISDESNPVEIDIAVLDKKLVFNCKNRINQNQKDEGSGIGIKNVEKRLQLLYPESHALTIDNDGKEFIVKLEINL